MAAWFASLVFLPTTFCVLYNREIYAVKDSRFSDVIIKQSVIDTIYNISTIMRCQSACMDNVWCSSFFFNKIDDFCQTNSIAFTGKEPIIHYAGTVYYTLEIAPEDFPNTFFNANLKLRVLFLLTQVPWTSGESYCRTYGGSLISLDNQAIVNFIRDIITSYRVLNVENLLFLVGGNDVGVEGDYRWNSGTVLPANSPLWCPGEPNNRDALIVSQDYIALSNTAICSLSLDDIFIWQNGVPICQVPYIT